jgi:aspartate beta-hydroxylase
MEAASSAVQFQLQTLVQSAKALIARGQHYEAETVFNRILDVAPYHRDALNFLAARSYARGDLSRCIALLEQAVRGTPHDALLQDNLAIAYLDSGHFDKASKQFDRVLELRPGDVDATLYKGFLLEREGRETAAVEYYSRACIAVGNVDSYLRATGNPPRMKERLRAAVNAVMREVRRIIEERLAPLRMEYVGADFSRVDRCVEIFTGGERYRPDALQRPSLLYFPGLPTKPFYERHEVPESAALESAVSAILSEFTALQDQAATFAPYVQGGDRSDVAQWRELNYSASWSAYHLYRDGGRLQDACEKCPSTAALLETLPLARISGHAPEVFFSALQPGTHIPPHFGLGNYKLAMHLPLILPGNCAIRVGNETREWEQGKCLIFDDSFQHEAWNRSEQPRVVLILDVWHPALQGHERAAICAILEAIGAFRQRYGLEFFKT